MKLRLSILLLAAAALVVAPAAGQTIKSLGYNTTNGQIVYSGTNDLRFPATIRIGTNQSGLGSGGQFLTLTDGAGGVAMIIGTNATTFYDPIAFSSTANAATTRTNLALGATWLTNTNVTNFRTDIGLGAADSVTFSNITANGIINAKNATASPATNSAIASGIQWTNLGGSGMAAIYGGYPGVPQIALSVGATNALTDVATFRATGMTVASNAVVGGTLAVSNAATFSTNVTVNGSLSVGSFTTTTPSTWALDATQTAAATNGRLTLPSNANVIRLTNNNAISSVTNGVLGAFYYLVNQATNAVTISNVGGITIDGAQNLTLSPNESATLVATGPTNVSVANRGDLTDVALGGTANTAPSQTASSGSSLMTRELVDARAGRRFVLRSTNDLTANSTAYVTNSQTLTLPAGTYSCYAALFASTASTNGGMQVEFIPSNGSVDYTVGFLSRANMAAHNGGGSQTFSVVSRVGNDLFQYLVTGFANAPEVATISESSGTVLFEDAVTIFMRVAQRSATDTNNPVTFHKGSFIEFVSITE